jgi:hypothetical protein
MEVFKRCGTCRHTGPVPNDLNTVACYGGPPQVILVPQNTPAGMQFVPQTVYPNLARTNRACSLHEPILVVEAKDAA